MVEKNGASIIQLQANRSLEGERTAILYKDMGEQICFAPRLNTAASQRGIFAIIGDFRGMGSVRQTNIAPSSEGQISARPPGGIPSAGVSARRFDQANSLWRGANSRFSQSQHFAKFGEIWRNFETL
jgi:hypothetical protein